ncbi:hypothetical protein NIES2119_21510 [[Phormidium ambiguum] IAM M-71]|uniref:Uncharacterized protein n=1 Tax=[Phormidium ambiguum] IAM M-71 TaxID=454136 RepID=A0A1U7IBW8_9CYAN|nr:hypothetical protein NIES2119_21510 [Phormidium ambiguum IAM M-71]
MPFLSDSSTFSITFDFESAEQKKILGYLQDNDYTLFGFKGATGTGQISAGVPVWFSVPFLNIFGDLSINYEPKYKLYAFYQAQIAAYTHIKMKVISEDEYALGSSVVFTQDGSFVTGTTSTPLDSIILTDARKDTSQPITVGLAGLVNLPSGLAYLPFCAFTLNPKGSITMRPVETICLFAAQAELSSGSVLGAATAPGCSFSFSAQTIEYKLMVQNNTYGITNVPNTKPVKLFPSNESLITLLNK